jgi:predicted acylesterase/phospholipase RssA
VIQRQLKEEKDEEAFSQSLFEVDENLISLNSSLIGFNFKLHEDPVEQIKDPSSVQKKIEYEEDICQKEEMQQDSMKTTTNPKSPTEGDMQDVFIEQKENSIDKKEEHKQKIIIVDFESRVRFTKRHDRGKNCSSMKILKFSIFEIIQKIMLNEIINSNFAN